MLSFFGKAAAVPPEKVLRKLGVAFETLADGSLFVPGDIDLSNRKLEELPDLSRVRVGGNFFCHGNRLKSLKGAPQIVLGAFFCHNNALETLEHAPHSVGGDFSCGYNLIRSLEGAPKRLGGSFLCYSNQLQSLRGGPRYISGEFACDKNDLTSLEDAPYIFTVLKSDFGEFPSWDKVPPQLAPHTQHEALVEKFKHEFERKTALEQAVSEAAILQKPLKVRKPIRLKTRRAA